MKKIFVALLVFSSSSVYAVNNNDLLVRLPPNNNDRPAYNGEVLDQTGYYVPCKEIESVIYNQTYSEINALSIQSCVSGNTYYRNTHGFANLFGYSPDTFDISGDKYQLQYFTDIESVNATLTIIKQVEQAKKTLTYNSCLAFNQKKINEYNESMSAFNKQKELFNKNYAIYNAQLNKYNKMDKVLEDTESKIAVIAKKAFDSCMSGKIVDSNGNTYDPSSCIYWYQNGVIRDAFRMRDYRNTHLGSLPVAPIMPNQISKPDIENCVVAESGI